MAIAKASMGQSNCRSGPTQIDGGALCVLESILDASDSARINPRSRKMATIMLKNAEATTCASMSPKRADHIVD
jgi:hypothetical protein